MVPGRARVMNFQKLLWNGALHDCSRISFSDSVGRPMLTAWADSRGALLKAEVAGVKLVRRADED
jgi:hypothetical protein